MTVAGLLRGSPRRLAAVLVAAVLLVGLVVLLWPSAPKKTAVAFFPRAIHIYKGSDVDVLGVKVGTVTAVQPVGQQVRVEFEYDAKQRIPAEASAVLLEPTLVADRVVQLTPAYTTGPVLRDGAVIPVQRTGIPVELDEFNRNLSRLAKALGPAGANRNGALSRLVAVGADNLRGQGRAANVTIKQLGELMGTLGDNRDALFGTVRNLQAFTTTLAAHDTETRAFTGDLATVSAELDAEREAFGAAMHNLAGALAEVSGFVKDNKDQLAANVGSLASVTNILDKERVLLAHMTDMGAVGVGNYPHMYTPEARTYNARFVGNAYSDNPALFVCQLYNSVGGSSEECLKYLAPLKQMPMPPKGQR